MVLYVMRHADALRVGGSIQRDADRPLSPRGEQDASLMAQAVVRLDPSIDLVLTSPLLRAVQTGDFFRTSLGGRGTFRTSENLSPGFRARDLLGELTAAGPHKAILCIGHEPDLSGFIGSVIAEGGRAAVVMPAAAVARVRFESDDPTGDAALQGLLTPDLVRSLQT